AMRSSACSHPAARCTSMCVGTPEGSRAIITAAARAWSASRGRAISTEDGRTRGSARTASSAWGSSSTPVSATTPRSRRSSGTRCVRSSANRDAGHRNRPTSGDASARKEPVWEAALWADRASSIGACCGGKSAASSRSRANRALMPGSVPLGRPGSRRSATPARTGRGSVHGRRGAAAEAAGRRGGPVLGGLVVLAAGPRVASERPVVVACVGVLGPVGRRRVVLLLVRAEQRGHHDVGAGGGRDRALVIGVVAVPAAHQLHVRREQRGRGGPGLWGGLGDGARLRQGVQRWCRFRRQALVLLVVGGLRGAR